TGRTALCRGRAPGRATEAAGPGGGLTVTTANRNGTFSLNARDAAGHYLSLGLAPIPVPPRSKNPGRDGWQNLRVTAETLDQHFPASADCNLGLLLGEPSAGLLDLGLDSVEAVRAAPGLLPATGMVSGRPGKPRSHYWYRVPNPPPKASDTLKDPDRDFYQGASEAAPGDEGGDRKRLLLELRSTGAQT